MTVPDTAAIQTTPLHPAVSPARHGVAIYNINPGDVTHHYSMSMYSMLVYENEHNNNIVGVFQRPGTVAPSATRSAGIGHFLEHTTAEWMLWIDSDIEAPADSIERILEVADPIDSPIICGLYISVLAEGLVPLMWHEDDTIFTAEEVNALLAENTRLVRVGKTGAGFLLIHHDVLTTMQKAFGADAWFGEEVRDGVRSGEDFTFCHRAQDCGYPVYVDIGLSLGHVKTIILHKSMLGNVTIEAAPDFTPKGTP